MKIEINPNRMSLSELSDCIAELSAQRDRLLEEEREIAEAECHDAFITALGQAWNYTETGNFDITLSIKVASDRRHRIPLNMEQIEEWHIEVNRKMEQ